jgi:transcriptional regulator with XRE-family HTH domain
MSGDRADSDAIASAPVDLDDDFSSSSDETLGSMLSGLRRAQGLTGQELAKRSGISQGQISKIENSKAVPSPDDVQRIAKALRASPKVVETLTDEAKQQHAAKPKASRRSSGRTGTINQQDLMDEEGRARYLRDFQAILVPGLLQTGEYTRRVINGFNALTFGENVLGWPDTAAALALRARRQERLYDLTKQFEFVIMETVFLHRFGGEDWPGFMIAQLQRIKDASMLENVSVCVLPLDAALSYPPLQSFTIMDTATVFSETTVGTLDRDRNLVNQYLRAFEQFRQRSTDDLDSVLSRHLNRLATELVEQQKTAGDSNMP